MFLVLLRSACIGIAAVMASACLAIAIVAYFALRNISDTGEVGWDIVSFAHNWPITSIVAPLVIFAIGFIIAFRYFSRSLAPK